MSTVEELTTLVLYRSHDTADLRIIITHPQTFI